MLRSLKQLYGDSIVATDVNIGHVKDFYFNDRQWAVRYVVVDTGGWLSGRLVLISPHAFGDFHEYGSFLLVNLTRQQIENSPPIDLHKPVSRHYEDEYYRYYGWPPYWEGGGLWGGSALPSVLRPNYTPDAGLGQSGAAGHEDDPHLRSAQALKGYHIQTSRGAIGHVTDFLIDDRSLEIRHLVIETGHWLWGKEIMISPKHIDVISYEESKVFVNITKESIMAAPQYHVARADYHEARESD